jgi:hypothetical protein
MIAHQCIPSTSCVLTGLYEETKCSESYTGVRCGKCVEGYFFSSAQGCRACLNGTILSVLLALIFVMIFAGTTYSILFLSNSTRVHLRQVAASIQAFGILSRLYVSSDSSSSSFFTILKWFDALVSICFNEILVSNIFILEFEF